MLNQVTAHSAVENTSDQFAELSAVDKMSNQFSELPAVKMSNLVLRF